VLRRGEVLCLLGRNGAGKTTPLKAIMGLVPARSGSIRLGRRTGGLPAHLVPRPASRLCRRGGGCRGSDVAENLEIG